MKNPSRTEGREVALSLIDTFIGYDMAAALAAVQVPIRSINGDLYPTDVDGNRLHAPSYAVTIMKGVGHYPMIERPEELNRHLAEVVAEMTGNPQVTKVAFTLFDTRK